MLIYLLKFSACLVILLAFYKLFLENLHIHKFKRAYLIGTLVLSVLIPFITFTEYVTVVSTEIMTTRSNIAYETSLVPHETKIDYISIILWCVYGLGAFLFALKFAMNLINLYKRIRQNPHKNVGDLKHVLLYETIVPHTFFKFLFFNKQKYNAKLIPREVFLHEETHANQKHSLDILFIELLQIIFWFNPFIYLIKHAVKLNHEFLADQGVLNKGVHSLNYQKILLAFSSPNNHQGNQKLALVNAINYSSIKKRITIMKTKKSKKSVLFRSLLLFPLLAILLYSFTETKIILKKEAITHDINNTDRLLLTTVNPKQNSNTERVSNRSVELAGLILDSETLLPLESVEIYDSSGDLLSKTDKRGYYKILIENLNLGEIRFELYLEKDQYLPLVLKEHWGNLSGKIKSTFYFGLQKKEVESQQFSELVTNNHNLTYQGILHNYNSSIKMHLEFNKHLQNAKEGNHDVLLEIDNVLYLANDHSWIEIHSKEDLILINDTQLIRASELNNLINRYEINGMTPLEKNNDAQFAVYTIRDVQQKIATRELMAEYNKLAKHYNDMPDDNMRIYSADVKRLKYIYDQMSAKQKQDAEPFPEFPEPPMPPIAPRAMKGEKSDVSPPPAPRTVHWEISDVPKPPTPISPLDHVIAMAKKGAVFYLEEKEITSDKAIAILKKNKKLNISTKKSNSKRPIVYISAKPIIIKN